ncbi:S-adenosyl-L-methionine-dependent methyltransferase [Podospora conica]|nr:S-adenosyl-L-methionine-dependent methyltransferase [Schizothecium conicum]
MSESYPISDSASSSSGDEAEWRAVANGDTTDGEEEEPPAIISLVDDRVFTDPVAALEHCKAKSGLDFLATRDRLGLDFHGMVKLINLVRQAVHEGKPVPTQIEAKDLDDEKLLKPVLEDDALIVCLDDLPPPAAATAAPANGGEEVDSLLKRNSELQAELEQLSKQFANYRLTVEKTLDERWQADDEPEDAPGTKDGGKKKDEYYFESYAHNDIHEVMIKDAVRTDAYRDFIYANKDLFAGKTVLDIGCGTGILSLFCARAGAARVIAVDRSDILDKARENVFSNGLDHIITCVKGRIEDVVLPVTQVDIIVSEWMGYCLLYEAMLPSVLYARDRYLAPGGLLVPSHCNMWVAPVSDAEYVADHITFWRDVYGFDFSGAMQRDIYADSRVTTMPTASLCGEPSMFRFLDLHTVKNEELVFTAPWSSALNKTDGALDGFLMWFDMFFARSRDEKIAATTTAQEWVKAGKTPDAHVAFTTGPWGIETHWRQILFLIDAKKKKIRQLGEADAGKKVEGEVSYITAEDHERGLEIKVTWKVEGEEQDVQSWRLH